MDEQALQDVAGFIASRDDPIGKVLEVEKLIEIQKDLGVSFDSEEQAPVDRLLKLEDRDIGDLAK
ncbi:hypothetical protein A2U01_0063617, partial [Trifolium medium]|nr:hypothetical protein [Trifolium medium]